MKREPQDGDCYCGKEEYREGDGGAQNEIEEHQPELRSANVD